MKIKIQKAAIDRPGDVGMDLPPGITARELAPADYHPVDMEEPETPAPARVRKHAKKAVRAKAPVRKANGRKAATRAHAAR